MLGTTGKNSPNGTPQLFMFCISLFVFCLFGITWFYTSHVKKTHQFEYKPYVLEQGRHDFSPENVSRGRTYTWPWFSLRSFWRENIPQVVKFQCGDDIILFKNAYLNVRKIQHAPVVIFAGGFRKSELWKELKENRDPSQIWVFTTDESALTTEEYIPPREHINELQFNITFTYHTKSELSIPYGYYELYSANYSGRSDKDIDYHKQKPKFAAFMSSHCDTIAWSRSDFAKDLSEHIPLDRFGRCGNISTSICPYNSRKCTKKLKQYKFILGLENTCCEEYITEKFWHPLVVLESIPVVLGANKVDYAMVGPPNSFIHAGDFNSMDELAIYLKKVADDSVLYNSYFQWKKGGYVRETRGKLRRIRHRSSACRLHEYIKSRAWADVEEHFNVYGEHWLGGCKGCSDKEWITDKYGKATSRYTHN